MPHWIRKKVWWETSLYFGTALAWRVLNTFTYRVFFFFKLYPRSTLVVYYSPEITGCTACTQLLKLGCTAKFLGAPANFEPWSSHSCRAISVTWVWPWPSPCSRLVQWATAGSCPCGTGWREAQLSPPTARPGHTGLDHPRLPGEEQIVWLYYTSSCPAACLRSKKSIGPQMADISLNKPKRGFFFYTGPYGDNLEC